MLIQNSWHKITYFIRDRRLDCLLVFLVVFLLMAGLQASPNFLDTESFYHAGLIESMEKSLTLDKFTWLQSTNYENSFVDNNWLYHLMLSLFVGVLPTFLIIKFFGVLFTALLALYIYYWLRKHNAKWPALFVLLLFSSQIFIRELNILGAEALSLLLLLLGIDLITNYKYWQLGILSIVLTLLSGNFIFLLVAAAGWLLVEFIYNKWNLDRFRTRFGNWRDFILRKIGLLNKMGRKKWLVLISCGVGLLVGLVAHPYWPNNMSFYSERVLNNTVYDNSVGIVANLAHLIVGAHGVLIALFIGLFGVLYNHKRISKLSANFLFLAVVFLILSLITEWGITFFILLSAILASLLYRDTFGNKPWSVILNKGVHNRGVQKFVNIVLVVIIIIIPLKSYYFTNRAIKGGYLLDYMQEGASWLYYHVPDNALVVNSDSQDWAPLFYYNNNNDYWWGLDPNLMRNKYPQTSDDFVTMLDGQSDRNPYALLKSKFRADYILVNKGRLAFNKQLQANIYFSLIYEDEEVWIYKIQ